MDRVYNLTLYKRLNQQYHALNGVQTLFCRLFNR